VRRSCCTDMTTEAAKPRYSVIVPAYNEAEWLPACLAGLHRAMDAVDLPGELLVVDNNSTDATADIARRADARVVFEPVNTVARRWTGDSPRSGDRGYGKEPRSFLRRSLAKQTLEFHSCLAPTPAP
jgi:GT2 family glycosyltransferase